MVHCALSRPAIEKSDGQWLVRISANVQGETVALVVQVGLWGICPGIFVVGDVDENVQGHIRCVYVIVLVPRFTKQESLGHVTKHSHHSTLQHYVGNTICESSTWLGIDRKPHFTENLSFICWKSDGFWRHSTPSLPLKDPFRDFCFVFSANVLHIFPKKLFQSYVYQSLVLFPELKHCGSNKQLGNLGLLSQSSPQTHRS